MVKWAESTKQQIRALETGLSLVSLPLQRHVSVCEHVSIRIEGTDAIEGRERNG